VNHPALCKRGQEGSQVHLFIFYAALSADIFAVEVNGFNAELKQFGNIPVALAVTDAVGNRYLRWRKMQVLHGHGPQHWRGDVPQVCLEQLKYGQLSLMQLASLEIFNTGQH
jgi:hypothetical protein